MILGMSKPRWTLDDVPVELFFSWVRAAFGWLFQTWLLPCDASTCSTSTSLCLCWTGHAPLTCIKVRGEVSYRVRFYGNHRCLNEFSLRLDPLLCLRWLHVLCAERADNSLCHRLLLFRWISSAGHGLGVFAGWGKSPNFIMAQQWRSASIVASKSVPFLCSHMGLD